ncbi:hypothetical protein [Maribacter sp. 2210JD10-5]|uniref:hypothetical protein n=1 Tax=Maribacter sp. 2210JD10-5 TaxID=3386272 RepID=UPI0039BD8858
MLKSIYIRSVLKVLSFFLLAGFTFSCSEELNFDQYEDLEVRPTLETSIFFIKTQESIINRINGINFFTQEFNFDAFEEAFFADRVLEGAITYELQNTTSKEVEISIEFLDIDGTVLDTEFFRLDPAPTATLQRVVAYGNAGKSLEILRNTSDIRLGARNLGDNTSTSDFPDPSLILRSSGAFTLRIK